MSQNTKYVLSILSLLFIITVGYSSYLIYNNKHNHGGSSSIFSSITGSNKPKVTDKTKEAQQLAKQNAQYNAKMPVPKQATIAANGQRLVVLDFYNEYFKNKKEGAAQSATLAKYGTANLASQYKSEPSGTDSFTCNPASQPDSASILNYLEGGTYLVQFSSGKNIVSSAQVTVTGQGASSLIDSIGCLGPI